MCVFVHLVVLYVRVFSALTLLNGCTCFASVCCFKLIYLYAVYFPNKNVLKV